MVSAGKPGGTLDHFSWIEGRLPMSINHLLVEERKQTPVEQQRIELVERKGKGHPDSICDAVAEAVSLALCREYLANFGRILHHNTDKAMLVAGRTEPRLGGGKVLEPTGVTDTESKWDVSMTRPCL